jgi:Berberine and berberine like
MWYRRVLEKESIMSDDRSSVPEKLRSKSVCVVRGCYLGTATEGREWLRPLRAAGTPLLGPYETGGININFMSSEYVSAAHIRAAYSARHHQRLVALKGQYDLANMFRFNANISPSHAMQEERR